MQRGPSSPDKGALPAWDKGGIKGDDGVIIGLIWCLVVKLITEKWIGVTILCLT